MPSVSPLISFAPKATTETKFRLLARHAVCGMNGIFFSPGDSEEGRLRSLWSAVLQQAFDDATGTGRKSVSKHDRNMAISFLTATTGYWTQQRDTVCGLAGVDADAVRDRVLARLLSSAVGV